MKSSRIIIDHDNHYDVSFRYRGLLKRKIYEVENKIDADLDNKSARYIIEGEKIFCFMLSLPLKNIFKADSVVKNAIIDRFVLADNILYDYKIISIEKLNINLMVYCVNGTGTIFFDDSFNKKKHINSVKTYQGLITKYIPKFRKREDMVIVARSLNYIYVILKRKGRMADNYVIPYDGEAGKMADLIKTALSKIKDSGCVYKKIYMINKIYKFNKDIINNVEAENEICLLS